MNMHSWVRRSPRDTLREMGKYKQLYLYIAPYMLLFFVFTVLPVLISIFYSFTSFNILEPARWLGLENYIRLFLDDDVFLRSFQNTMILAVVTGRSAICSACCSPGLSMS